MNNENNILYDIFRIKTDIEFIYRDNAKDQYQLIKHLLWNKYNKIQAKDSKVYYLHFTENSTKGDENNLILPQDPVFKLIIILGQESLYNSYYSSISKSSKGNAMIYRLIFIVNEDTKLKANDSKVKVIVNDKTGEEMHSHLYVLFNEILIEYKAVVIKKKPLVKQGEFTMKKYHDIKKRLEEMIHLQLYSEAIDAITIIIDTITLPLDKAKAQELKALLLINSNLFKSNNNPITIKYLFENAIEYYSQGNHTKLLLEALLRIASYYAYHHYPQNLSPLITSLNQLSITILSIDDPMVFDMKLSALFQSMQVFSDLNMKRKSVLFSYLIILQCLSSPKYKDIIPILFKQIQASLRLYPLDYDSLSYEDYVYVKKMMIKMHYNPFEYYAAETNEELRKKGSEKRKRIIVKKRKEDPKLRNYCLDLQWGRREKKMYSVMIDYYMKRGDIKKGILLAVSYLQIFTDELGSREQLSIERILNGRNVEQEMMEMNMMKMPTVIWIKPIPSMIKIDTENNTHKLDKTHNESFFLYNPWDINSNNTVKYYWTEQSCQDISIHFHNPFLFKLSLTNITILFKHDSNNDHNITVFPSSITIQPKSNAIVISKILIKSRKTPISIIGIQYTLFNIFLTKQYVDINGNGFFYSSYNSNSKDNERHLLHNIPILPTIPLLSITPKDNEPMASSLELTISQQHSFSFVLNNIGGYDINGIKVFISLYKKNGYKKSLSEHQVELLIRKGKSAQWEYCYLHKKGTIKIEFVIYYYSDDKDKEAINEDVLMKPHLEYVQLLSTRMDIISFSNGKVKVKNDDCSVRYIISKDRRIMRWIKECSWHWCSNEYYITMQVDNRLGKKVHMVIKDKHQGIIKEELCKGRSSHNVAFMYDANKISNYNDLGIEWNCDKGINYKGLLLLNQCFNMKQLNMLNQSQIHIDISITKDMNFSNDNDESNSNSYTIHYSITAISSIPISNLTSYIYIYQDHINNTPIAFNYQLKEKLFFNGSLNFSIPSISTSSPSHQYSLQIFPFNPTELFKTFLILHNASTHQLHISSPVLLHQYPS